MKTIIAFYMGAVFFLWGCQNSSIPTSSFPSDSESSPADDPGDSPKKTLEPQDDAKKGQQKKPSDGGNSTATPSQNVMPMLSQQVTSGWCKKRSVGTCPHIGVDLVPNSGAMNSYAIGTGTVTEIRNVGGCGHQVQFKDNNSAVWGYLHVAKPPYGANHKLTVGELVGKWYGGSGSCVTGPHLHLERLQPGSYGGEKTGGNHCGTGFRNCNYDPYTPLTKMTDMKNEEGRKAIVAKAKGGASYASQSSPPPAPVCSGPALQSLPAVGDVDMDDMSPHLEASILGSQNPLGAIVLRGPLTQSGVVSPTNSCEGSMPCIVSWQLSVRSAHSWVRVGSALGTQNAPIFLASTPFCSGQQKVFPWSLEVTLDTGTTLKTAGTVEVQ